MDTADEYILQCMREWPMAYVVKEDGDLGSELLFGSDVVAFDLEYGDSLAHEVKGTEGVMKTRMIGTGIYIAAKAQLLDAPETLEIRMLYDIEYELMRNGDKAMHRVVKYLALIV
jgi:hypothetical protein